MDMQTINAWVQAKLDYLKLGFNTLLSVLGKVEHELLDLLDLAQEDGPKVVAFLGTSANLITTALPNGKLGSYVNTAAKLIDDALPYVRTADGILMSLAQATEEGAHVDAEPVPLVKAVTELMAVTHPDVPEDVHAHIVAGVAAAVAQGVTAIAPAVLGA